MTALASYLDTADITRSAFAARVGISKSYLTEIAQGPKCPGLAVALRIERETAGAVPVSSWSSPSLAPSDAGSEDLPAQDDVGAPDANRKGAA